MKLTAWRLFCAVLMIVVAIGSFAGGLTIIADDAYAIQHCNCLHWAGCHGCLIGGSCIIEHVCPQQCL